MEPATYGLEELGEAEAFALLRQARVGRVVYTDSALPGITPVNFVLDGRAVVFRTAVGSSLAKAVNGAVVAFEVDDVRHEPGPWWSVVILGMAQISPRAVDARKTQRLTVTPWVMGDRTCYVRIEASRVTGRRLVRIDTPADRSEPV